MYPRLAFAPLFFNVCSTKQCNTRLRNPRAYQRSQAVMYFGSVQQNVAEQALLRGAVQCCPSVGLWRELTGHDQVKWGLACPPYVEGGMCVCVCVCVCVLRPVQIPTVGRGDRRRHSSQACLFGETVVTVYPWPFQAPSYLTVMRAWPLLFVMCLKPQIGHSIGLQATISTRSACAISKA